MRSQSLPAQPSLGVLLGAAVRRIRRAVGMHVARHGMTARQFGVMVAVLETDGPSVDELAARLRIDAPTASRIVASLVRARLVLAVPDEDDRRRLRLRPGPAARALRRTLLALARRTRAAVFAGFSDAERDALVRSLHRVIDNADRFAREAVPRAAARKGVPT